MEILGDDSSQINNIFSYKRIIRVLSGINTRELNTNLFYNTFYITVPPYQPFNSP